MKIESDPAKNVVRFKDRGIKLPLAFGPMGFIPHRQQILLSSVKLCEIKPVCIDPTRLQTQGHRLSGSRDSPHLGQLTRGVF